MNVIEAIGKRNPMKDLLATILEEALPDEIIDDIERLEQEYEECNSKNRVHSLNIRHGPSGSPTLDEMVRFEYPDLDIFDHADLPLNATINAEVAKNAVQCDISQPDVNSNRLESLMRSEVHHELISELSLKHFDNSITIQQKQKPVDQLLSSVDEGGAVIANNLLQLSENHDQLNTRELENMQRVPLDIDPVDDESSSDIGLYQLEEVPPDPSSKFQKDTSNKSGEGVLQAGKKVRSKIGNGHASNVKNSNSFRKDTLKIGARTYSCEECNRQFKRNSSLTIHLRTHSGEKPYECEVCGNSFSQIGCLRSHLRIHTGEKPYNCEICAKSFAQSSALSNHLRIHTGERPYNCEICSKSFTQMIHLRSHLRIHTVDKPYKCEKCSKSFTRSINLRNHLLTHATGKNTHKC